MVLLLFLALQAAADTTKTVVSFSRKIDTCDPQDRPLQDGISKVVWSYSNTLPKDDNGIQRHDERGVQSVRFFSQNDSVPLPPDVQYFDIGPNDLHVTFNNPRHGPTTNYWCTAYKVPMAAKQHIVRMEPIIDPRAAKQVHHIIIYQCNGTLTDEELAYSDGCYGMNMPQNLVNCNGAQVLTVWAVGGSGFNLPSNVGMPIGPGTTYLLMDTHYDNPNQVQVIDSSAIRFYYTSTLREQDAGIFATGHVTDSRFTIPPAQTAYRYDAWCPSECTQKMFPQTGLHVISGFLHTHTTGISANFSIIRNGQAFAPTLDEPYYDFNYQDFTYFPEDVMVYPGDRLYTVCNYNTQYKTGPTYFGLSTDEEMCTTWLAYWPKIDYTGCIFGDYTGMVDPPYDGKTAFCGIGNPESPEMAGQAIQNYTVPAFSPYVAPACQMSTPSAELTTPTSRTTFVHPSDYEKSQFLDTDGKYKLYWTVDREQMVFHAAVEVETTGWVGLGISEMGMQGADVLMAWSKDGEPHFADRFAVAKALPLVDASQDYYAISVGQVTQADSGLSNTQIAIIGAAAGGGIVLVVGLLVFICWRRKKSNKKYSDLLEEDPEDRPTYGADTRASVPLK